MFAPTQMLKRQFAPGRRNVVAVRRAMAISNKMALVPCGDGDTQHLGDSVPDQQAPKIDLAEGLFEVGRMQPADIVIPIPSVSGRHAMIRVDDSRITLTDLRSTNGTFIDGQELEPMQAYEVVPGTQIIFGDEHLAMYEVRLEDDPPAAEEAPAASSGSESM
eukprot:jgi/Ulvmu1/7295/UM035_0084.1